MNNDNKLIIAAAGSGKTSFLVNEALKNAGSNILITTYTQANAEEIQKRFIRVNKCVPRNITIQTWFSFLIQHGVKPFQGSMGLQDYCCNGLILVNGQSERWINEKNVEKHFFSTDGRIYSDKLSKFVVRCDTRSVGAVINRVSRIYSHIFIDEVQDLSGYDLDFIRLLFNSESKILLVGDPRQSTYVTNDSSRNVKFRKEKIVGFFQDKSIAVQIDKHSFATNYRSHEEICAFSNRIYPAYPETVSGVTVSTGHDGVFLVDEKKVESYLSEYKPVQLRWDLKTKVSDSYDVFNFGLAKGLEFDRVLIYPTKQFVAWLKDNKDLKPTSKSKFYVAITRARFSVGIVWSKKHVIKDIKVNYWF